MFITFEGSDGSGKTTQIEKLDEWLQSIGKNTLVTKEPGGTDFGSKIREIILNFEGLDKFAELALFLADRAQNVTENVNPNKDNKIVICDRFIDSTVAYQCYGNKTLDEDLIRKLNSIFTQECYPDKVFILDVDFKVSKKRMEARGDQSRFDLMDENYFRSIQTYYRSLKDKKPMYSYIDTTDLNPDEVFKLIQKDMKELLDETY